MSISTPRLGAGLRSTTCRPVKNASPFLQPRFAVRIELRHALTHRTRSVGRLQCLTCRPGISVPVWAQGTARAAAARSARSPAPSPSLTLKVNVVGYNRTRKPTSRPPGYRGGLWSMQRRRRSSSGVHRRSLHPAEPPKPPARPLSLCGEENRSPKPVVANAASRPNGQGFYCLNPNAPMWYLAAWPRTNRAAGVTELLVAHSCIHSLKGGDFFEVLSQTLISLI